MYACVNEKARERKRWYVCMCVCVRERESWNTIENLPLCFSTSLQLFLALSSLKASPLAAAQCENYADVIFNGPGKEEKDEVLL